MAADFWLSRLQTTQMCKEVTSTQSLFFAPNTDCDENRNCDKTWNIHDVAGQLVDLIAAQKHCFYVYKLASYSNSGVYEKITSCFE